MGWISNEYALEHDIKAVPDGPLIPACRVESRVFTNPRGQDEARDLALDTLVEEGADEERQGQPVELGWVSVSDETAALDTGGSAFASPDTEFAFGSAGMTLLDWFAGRIAAGDVSTYSPSDASRLATDSYLFAEAMLLEKRRREAAARKLGKGEIKS